MPNVAFIKGISDPDLSFDTYLGDIKDFSLLSKLEEVRLAKQLRLYRDGFYRAVLKSDYGVKLFYEYYENSLDKYERQIKEYSKSRKVRYQKRRQKLMTKVRANNIKLGRRIDKIESLNNEIFRKRVSKRKKENYIERKRMHLRNASQLIDELMRLKENKNFEIDEEIDIMDFVRKAYESGYKEIEGYRINLNEAREKNREYEVDRLEQRISGLENRYSREFGRNWRFKNWLMQKRYEKYQNIKQEFITGNLRLVVNIAKKYRDKCLSINDLIQEGNRGLIRAVERYDYEMINPETGEPYAFSTLAWWHIKKNIRRVLDGKTKIVKIPRYLTEINRKLRGVKQQLYHQLGREPFVEEIADETGINVSVINMAKEALKSKTFHINSLIRWGDDQFLEKISENEKAEEKLVRNKRLKDAFREVLYSKLFTSRDREIIKLRWGLFEYEGQEHTLEETGSRVGLTRERVSQIEDKLLDNKFKHPTVVRKLERFIS